MKKSFNIEVDCANCANQVEEAIKKIAGIENVIISFMTQKMKIEFSDDADIETIMQEVAKTAKRIEPDFAIH